MFLILSKVLSFLTGQSSLLGCSGFWHLALAVGVCNLECNNSKNRNNMNNDNNNNDNNYNNGDDNENNTNNNNDNYCERRLILVSAPCDYYIYISFGLPPIFKERITCFLVFLSLWPFYKFFKWILLLLVQVKHKRTFL